VEFARRLVTDHEFSVTVVTITGLSDPATDDAVLSSMPPSVTSAVLPAVALDDLPADFSFGAVMFELVRRSIPHLHDLMVGSSVAAFVCDFFGTSALSLARELGVPGYVFLPNSFAMVSLMRHVAELHRDAEAGEYRNIPEPLPFPGGPLLRHADIPDGFPDWTDPVYAYVVEEARRYARADGFLVNSFEELETTMAESFKRDAVDGVFPLVYPVGPFVRSSTSSGAGSPAGGLGGVRLLRHWRGAVRGADGRDRRRAGGEWPRVPLGRAHTEPGRQLLRVGHDPPRRERPASVAR
jgi:hydroquinone glucosyltransferase